MAMDKNIQKNKAKSLIDFLVDNGYYGELTIKFEVGNIVHLKVGQGLKIENLDLRNIFLGSAKTSKRKKVGFSIKEITEKEETKKVG